MVKKSVRLFARLYWGWLKNKVRKLCQIPWFNEDKCTGKTLCTTSQLYISQNSGKLKSVSIPSSFVGRTKVDRWKIILFKTILIIFWIILTLQCTLTSAKKGWFFSSVMQKNFVFQLDYHFRRGWCECWNVPRKLFIILLYLLVVLTPRS